MLGKITSLDNGPKRNVRITITPAELYSEISSPSGHYIPTDVSYLEIRGLQEHETGVITLTFVLLDGRRVLFYSTETKFDMVLLLDELEASIGARRREAV